MKWRESILNNKENIAKIITLEAVSWIHSNIHPLHVSILYMVIYHRSGFCVKFFLVNRLIAQWRSRIFQRGVANLIGEVSAPDVATFHGICVSKRKHWYPWGRLLPWIRQWVELQWILLVGSVRSRSKNFTQNCLCSVTRNNHQSRMAELWLQNLWYKALIDHSNRPFGNGNSQLGNIEVSYVCFNQIDDYFGEWYAFLVSICIESHKLCTWNAKINKHYDVLIFDVIIKTLLEIMSHTYDHLFADSIIQWITV